MMKLLPIVLTVASVLPGGLSLAPGMVAVRQDTDRNGHIEFMNANSGYVTAQANLSFPFSWPYAQMTTDVTAGTTYLSAFPDGRSYPVLYVLNRDLELASSFDQSDFTWWDLQVAPRQSTLYGILVTKDFNGGMSGRTLSNYTYTTDGGETDLSASQLYTLPYMWYVNASSIDQLTNTYFALVNNFPGHENSTLEQKLVIADFSQPMLTPEPADAEQAVVELDLQLQDVMAQFIAYSHSVHTLYFSGPSKTPGTDAVTVGVLCAEHGKVERVMFEATGVSLVGPLVADDAQQRLLFFIQRKDSAAWKLMSVGYEEGSVAVEISSYEGTDFMSFAAAAHMLA